MEEPHEELREESTATDKGTAVVEGEGGSNDFPALEKDHVANCLEDIKSQWLRYNHRHQPQKHVIAMVSDAKKGLWKSICACVKGIKTVKEWKANEICKAHIFVSKSTVKSIDLNHTCTAQHAGRKRNYNSKQLHMASNELLKTLHTPGNNKRARHADAAQQYIDAASKEGFAVGKATAYKVVSELSRQPIEAQIGEFYFLTSMFQSWKRADPDGSYSLEKNPCSWKPNAEQFQRYYIAPSISKHAWKNSKVHLFISDAYETSSYWSSFQMSSLVAVTLDGNDEVVVLALALCHSDSELNWIWFLQNLMRDFNNIQVFLSSANHVTDGKHIPNLLDLMNAVPSRCVSSLIASVEKSLSIELSPNEKNQIHRLARSTSLQAYEKGIREISSNNPDVAVFLDGERQKFVSHFLMQVKADQPILLRKRFGAILSNANTLINENVHEIKDKPIASMTISLMMRISNLHLERKLRAQHLLDTGQLLSDHALRLYETITAGSKEWRVQMVSQEGNVWRGVVSQARDRTTNRHENAVSNFVVSVNTGSFKVECSCQYSEEMGLPCIHGAAMLRSQNLNLGPDDAQWFHPRYHVTTLIQMYDCEPPDFSVFGKVTVQELVPPEHISKIAPKRRKPSSSTPNNPHKCAACGQLGHHPKTCHQPSTKYRYSQFVDRAMEWAKSALDLQV